MLAAVRDGHAVHHRFHALTAFLGRHTHVEQRQFDVLEHVEFVDEVKTLEDEANNSLAEVCALVLLQVAHVAAIQQVGAFGGIVEQAEDIQQRGFATTRRPHDGDKLAFLHLEVHIAERPGLDFFRTEHLLDVF